VHILLSGWFSFEEAEVTAGDLLARDVTAAWLGEAGIDHDVAVAATFRREGEVALSTVDPGAYSDLLFVCGPAAGASVEELFTRFRDCRRVAVDVSLVAGSARVPFDFVVERDGPDRSFPDLSLLASVPPTPVVAVVRGHEQPEYEGRQRLADAHAAIDRLLTCNNVAPVAMDTWLHPGHPEKCSNPGQVESVFSRMDAVITTRLHGLVLALKVGVPAVAVDPITGGGKIARQASALGWPAVACVDDLDDDVLAAHLAWCLSPSARPAAIGCAAAGRAGLNTVRARLFSALGLA
jgi:hypothetical protein